jgi:dephospho-CoA kinase
MIIVGLTGSIGMGKSTASGMLRQLGIPVHEADAVVHILLAPGGAAVPAVLAAFPGTGNIAGGIDRAKLGAIVFGDAVALRRLEAILHPMVRRAELRFLALQQRRRVSLVVLDIPLLYETGGERRCDAVLVVSAPEFLQKQRVLRRPGMTAAKFHAIRAKQMPDAVKRRRTPWIIPTGLGRAVTRRALRKALAALGRSRP